MKLWDAIDNGTATSTSAKTTSRLVTGSAASGPSAPSTSQPVTSETYSNDTPTTVDIGGIESGTTFTDESMSEMWDSLLYPYQHPAFTAFEITGQAITLEVGDSTEANPVFTWTTTNQPNVQVDSISIVDATTLETLASNQPDNGILAVTHAAVTATTETSELYQIVGTNTDGETFSKDYRVYWKWKKYYGESSSATLDESGIESLRVGKLSSDYSGTYEFAYDTGKYKYICYPSSLGSIVSFKDQRTGLDVPFETAYTVSVTNTFGVTTNYSVYRTTNKIGGAIDIVVT